MPPKKRTPKSKKKSQQSQAAHEARLAAGSPNESLSSSQNLASPGPSVDASVPGAAASDTNPKIMASADSTDVPTSTPPASTHEFEDSAAPASEQNTNIASNASPSAAEEKEPSETSGGSRGSVPPIRLTPPPRSAKQEQGEGVFHDIDDGVSSHSSGSARSNRSAAEIPSLDQFSTLDAVDMYQDIINHCKYPVLVQVAEKIAGEDLSVEDFMSVKQAWLYAISIGVSPADFGAIYHFPPKRLSAINPDLSADQLKELDRLAIATPLPKVGDVKAMFKTSRGDPMLCQNTGWSANHTRVVEKALSKFIQKLGLRTCEVSLGSLCTALPCQLFTILGQGLSRACQLGLQLRVQLSSPLNESTAGRRGALLSKVENLRMVMIRLCLRAKRQHKMYLTRQTLEV
jgi:hypothetical protein